MDSLNRSFDGSESKFKFRGSGVKAGVAQCVEWRPSPEEMMSASRRRFVDPDAVDKLAILSSTLLLQAQPQGSVTSLNGEVGAITLESPDGSVGIVATGGTAVIKLTALAAPSLGLIDLGDPQWGLGTVNDTAQLQAAINAACNKTNFPNGCVIYFNPRLTYTITGPIQIPASSLDPLTYNPSGVSFLGAGKETSLINLTAAGGNFSISPPTVGILSPGLTITLTFSPVGFASYTSPSYVTTAYDSITTISENIVKLIINDPSSSNPLSGATPWMQSVTGYNFHNKGTPYARQAELDFSVLPEYYGTISGTFSATISGTGNAPRFTPSNSGQIEQIANINYDIFSTPAVTTTSTNTAANGFGASGIKVQSVGSLGLTRFRGQLDRSPDRVAEKGVPCQGNASSIPRSTSKKLCAA